MVIKRYGLAVCIIITAFFNLSCFNGLTDGCFMQFPDEKSQTTIFEVESGPDFSSFDILRTTVFTGSSGDIPYNYDLSDFTYSIDGYYAYFLSYTSSIGKKLINYGPNHINYNNELGPLNTISGIPYPPENFEIDNSFEFQFFSVGNFDSVIVEQHFLLKNNYVSKNEDTVLTIIPRIIDSLHVTTYDITDAEIDKDGKTWIVVKEFVAELDTNNILFGSYPVPRNQEFINSKLITINQNNQIDTLLTSDEEFSDTDDSTIRILGDKFFFSNNREVYLLNPATLEKKFLYSGSLPVRISSNGRYVTLPYYYVFDVQDLQMIELQSIENVSEMYPGDNFVALLHKGNELISMYNYSEAKVTKQISLNDVPSPEPEKHHEFTDLSIRSPYLNKDGKLIFMVVRFSDLLDPDFKCYD